jgi:hypothetical protein
MTSPEAFDAGVAHQIGHYADAVRVPSGYDQILVSGTPGLAPDGSVAVRSTFLSHEPAFMLGVIPGLVRPEFLVQVEVIAAGPATQAP